MNTTSTKARYKLLVITNDRNKFQFTTSALSQLSQHGIDEMADAAIPGPVLAHPRFGKGVRLHPGIPENQGSSSDARLPPSVQNILNSEPPLYSEYVTDGDGIMYSLSIYPVTKAYAKRMMDDMERNLLSKADWTLLAYQVVQRAVDELNFKDTFVHTSLVRGEPTSKDPQNSNSNDNDFNSGGGFGGGGGFGDSSSRRTVVPKELLGFSLWEICGFYQINLSHERWKISVLVERTDEDQAGE
ncbi:hypothetical protein DFH27DRAFT_522953 [Peziza echinospora]|nr:hypothetical protein DFH27DRAFT_522953 [Peziza echinospora]